MIDIDPDDFIIHYGKKGMHWGIRKERPKVDRTLRGLGPDKITRTTKNGDQFTLSKSPPNKLNKFFAKVSQNYVDGYNNGAFLDIKDKNGKKIGNANFWKKSDDELYLNWLQINPSERGKGYAKETLKVAEQFGKEQGFKKMTLEVPGVRPEARHIYESMGFKVIKEDIDPNDPIWGGLTSMEYNFK